MFHHANQIAVVAGLLEATVPNEDCPEAGFEEQAVGKRRRPGDLLHALRPAYRLGGRLRRCRRRAAADTRNTQILLVPEQIDLVARRCLQRQPQAHVLPRPIVSGLPC